MTVEFDPNSVGLSTNQIFGLPTTEASAKIVLIPVPWDVTVSYGSGTHKGPEAILKASYQVDLYDSDYPNLWRDGVWLSPISDKWLSRSDSLRPKAEQIIEALQSGVDVEQDASLSKLRAEINAACQELRHWVQLEAKKYLDSGKVVGLLGGDHSTPLGFLSALAENHENFGILQIDAHCDLRKSYEGFEFSHASIMWNALKLKQISKLVQVGIRDYCEAEVEVIRSSENRISTFFDSTLKQAEYSGTNWNTQCERIISELPKNVYVSFDIDGLDPKLCPHTGTPVPGGLEYEQAVHLIRKVVQSGRKIIGFDLNEVSPGDSEWDANVGARLLYKLCAFALLGK